MFNRGTYISLRHSLHASKVKAVVCQSSSLAAAAFHIIITIGSFIVAIRATVSWKLVFQYFTIHLAA
jgi:hypothetical protein